ncbi:hypothetical protein [Geoglobus sp.]
MRKVRLHTTVSPETYRRIEELKKRYGTVSAVVEKAVENLAMGDEYVRLSEDDIMLLNFVKELNFTICAKDHYTGLAEGKPDRAVQESMVEMAIKYLSKKPLGELTLEEFLDSLRRLWLILNRGEHIEIHRLESGLNFVFYHDMRSMRVSEIHLELLRYVHDKYYAREYELEVDAITVNGFSVIFRRKRHSSSP